MTDYTSLITPQHRKPKFEATVEAVTLPIRAAIDALAHIPIDFDLDTAIGVQLDVVGEWVGRSRHVFVPIVHNWFSLDVVGKGLDQAEWYQAIPGDSNVTDLDDETYRRLLRAKIAANEWDGTAAGAVDVLKIFFGEQANIFVEDTQDMHAKFCFAGTLPSPLFLILFARGYIPLKPGGVGTEYFVTSVDGAPIFGFDATSSKIAGWDAGAIGVNPETFFT